MYNRHMDRKSKILLYIFLFLFIGTVMFSFARYMIFHDFEVIMSSDSAEESVSPDQPVIDAWTVDDNDVEMGNVENPTE